MKKSGKNLTIQWLKYALLDLRDIREYISQDNPEAAGNVIFTIIDTVERLAMFSQMGKKFFVFYIRRESFLKDYK